MRCDDFLRRFATGNVVERLLARLHAARCPRCAAARRSVQNIERQFSALAPLTLAHRRLWEQAAEREPPGEVVLPPVSRARVGWSLAIAASLLLAGGLLWLNWPGGPPRQQPLAQREHGAVKSPVRSQPLDTARQIAQVDTTLARLSVDLDRLDQLAGLLESRQQASELAMNFPSLGKP